MCTVLLSPAGNPVAVNKYIIFNYALNIEDNIMTSGERRTGKEF
jgi:hypothetical protein